MIHTHECLSDYVMQLTLADLHELLGGKLRLGAMPPRDGETTLVGPVVVDSREVESDEVFWGLVGSRFNGAHFAEEAFVRGAAGVVVSGRRVEPWAGRWALEVDDSQKSMWELAAWNRSRCSAPVVAIAGSVGKSTTRRMIDTVLGYRLCGAAIPKKCNNQIDVPLSLLALEQWHQYGLVELSANRPGEIARLARLARPQFGVITNVHLAYPAGFTSADSVARSHAELLSELPQGTTAILNADEPALRRVASRWAGRIVWIGRGAECDISAVDVISTDGRLRFRVEHQAFDIPVWGRHHVTSALAAIAVGRSFGLDLREIATALTTFRSLPMRCEMTGAAGVQIINDAYDSNPTSMRAALELLREIDTSGRRILVSGDYSSLAFDSPDAAALWHQRLGADVVDRCGADQLIACGRQAERVATAAIAAGMPADRAVPFARWEETLEHLSGVVRAGDVVLVKGGRSMGMERIVESLKSRLASKIPLRIAA
ncbi:MAG TPA: UDP-N-acetylmuramoyl-tripeptide--D-alanyl-D-alanine ligase [Pirellulales bacterium]|jgi:UDP-N-acetylmuramoyl-tripeptide--D-alanyl-D-alanine ligase|nr:UDP-N-acetylmuramoyl-tripeptide--D-alanyl-D-alanine ligase [Pirellulales bacterium]